MPIQKAIIQTMAASLLNDLDDQWELVHAKIELDDYQARAEVQYRIEGHNQILQPSRDFIELVRMHRESSYGEKFTGFELNIHSSGSFETKEHYHQVNWNSQQMGF